MTPACVLANFPTMTVFNHFTQDMESWDSVFYSMAQHLNNILAPIVKPNDRVEELLVHYENIRISREACFNSYKVHMDSDSDPEKSFSASNWKTLVNRYDEFIQYLDSMNEPYEGIVSIKQLRNRIRKMYKPYKSCYYIGNIPECEYFK